ncbi:MAG: LysE family translocator [Paenibacillus sp.]|nr:LysE family translocator [Paenibacillus sp.]
MTVFLKGMIIGLSIAAPVGPIGILCIRRTLNQGRLYGFISGAGAATADAFYGCVAAFGLTIISHFLMEQRLWIQFVGGLFLLYMGIQSMRSVPNTNTSFSSSEGLLTSYLSTFILTLTNPMTILAFIGVFAGLGISSGSNTEAVFLVTGVFMGSLLWWLLLSNGIGLIKGFINNDLMVWINRCSGMVLIIFGIVALIKIYL